MNIPRDAYGVPMSVYNPKPSIPKSTRQSSSNMRMFTVTPYGAMFAIDICQSRKKPCGRYKNKLGNKWTNCRNDAILDHDGIYRCEECSDRSSQEQKTEDTTNVVSMHPKTLKELIKRVFTPTGGEYDEALGSVCLAHMVADGFSEETTLCVGTDELLVMKVLTEDNTTWIPYAETLGMTCFNAMKFATILKQIK